MDIINKINNALENNRKDPILQFGNFHINGYINGGQQGAVYLVNNHIGIHFALKLYCPNDKSPKIIEDSVNNFIKEVKMLVNLNHKNIVAIYTGGFGIHDDNDLWNIQEGFDNFNKLTEKTILYFVMDFINWKYGRQTF